MGAPAAISGAITALSGYERLALGVVTAVGFVVCVSAIAALAAIWARYPRRANLALWLLLLRGLALVLLAVAEGEGMVSPFVFDGILAAAHWAFQGAVVFASGYVFWSGFAERVLSTRYLGGAIAISASFGASWLTLQDASSAANDVSMLWGILLPLYGQRPGALVAQPSRHR